MKRLDMLNELSYTISNAIVDELAPEAISWKVLKLVERYGMEPPIILKKGESDGPGEGQLVNEWE